ncbi:hypothetical protein Ahy_A08g037510 [Arachis hypogaea]|uniref:Photosystem II reaction center protein M n=1 Tax=Arachis hypogaea TaxID=3818 RepID=A0A445BR04_ARAHY|nr:hypothetical protein Ahy_A08g037510 [Arachis hypogaea]
MEVNILAFIATALFILVPTAFLLIIYVKTKSNFEKRGKKGKGVLKGVPRSKFNSLVDQATPGFELGKKDLQSPALPLGHAAKTIYI